MPKLASILDLDIINIHKKQASKAARIWKKET